MQNVGAIPTTERARARACAKGKETGSSLVSAVVQVGLRVPTPLAERVLSVLLRVPSPAPGGCAALAHRPAQCTGILATPDRVTALRQLDTLLFF